MVADLNAEIFDKIKYNLDRVGKVFLSTIDFVYRELYLKLPCHSSRFRICPRIKNHFNEQLKVVFGEEQVKDGATAYEDAYTRRITIDEMSLAYMCCEHRYPCCYENTSMVSARFTCFAEFPKYSMLKDLMWTDNPVSFRLPTLVLYFSSEPECDMLGAILAHELHFDKYDRLFLPWHHPFSILYPHIRKYCWMKEQFAPDIRRNTSSVDTFGQGSKISFPTFRLFCTAINVLMHGILDTDAAWTGFDPFRDPMI